MKINWKDFGITLIISIIIAFGVMIFIHPIDFISIIEILSYTLFVIFVSSVSLIFYIKRNNPTYKETMIVSFLIFFIIFLASTALDYYSTGFIGVFAAVILLFVIFFIASPFLTAYLKFKKQSVLKVMLILIVFLLVFLFYTGIFLILLIDLGFGTIFSIIFAIFGVSWKFVLEKTGMQ